MVLVYAHRQDVPDHLAYREWLEGVIGSQTAYGISELVLSGFIRVVTHPKVFEKPSPLDAAMAFVEQIRSQGHAIRFAPGGAHWSLFVRCL